MELDCSRRVKWSSTKQFDEEQYTPRRPAVIKRARPRPVVARFVLDSPVLPLVEDTLKIAELARRSFMGKYRRIEEQRLYGGPTPEGVMLPRSEVFSGKDADGRYLQGHQHAFYLPTDEDADGRIDHLTVIATMGLGRGEECERHGRQIGASRPKDEQRYLLNTLLERSLPDVPPFTRKQQMVVEGINLYALRFALRKKAIHPRSQRVLA